jgi:hypothetical protein
MFSEKGFQKSFRSPETCSFQFADSLSEVNQAAFRREIEQTQRAGDAEPLLFGGVPLRSSIHSKSERIAAARAIAAASPL